MPILHAFFVYQGSTLISGSNPDNEALQVIFFVSIMGAGSAQLHVHADNRMMREVFYGQTAEAVSGF